MSNKIVIEYTRREAAMGGYYLFAKVKPETVPNELEECLVYSRASEDRLVKVATLAEMTSLTEDTSDYAYIKASNIPIPAVISAGDKLIVSVVPSLWNEIGYTVPKTYRIEERINTGAEWYLRIVPDLTYPDYFPAYAKEVNYAIVHAGGTVVGTDGVILRRTDNVGDTHYRVNQQHSLFDTVSNAGAVLTELETKAQDLIDDYNKSLWPPETFEETYE